MDRRHFLKASAAAGTLAATRLTGQERSSGDVPTTMEGLFRPNGIAVPDDGWNLWLDDKATWQNDEIHLPGTFHVDKLPSNPPTGGWAALEQQRSGPLTASVTLPSTVEQHFWGKVANRPYTPEEYRYAAEDIPPKNGAYQGVSWWWRDIDIPASMQGKRILLQIRGARMRAEVYLNEKLTGYSILEELPFECDLTEAARPGGRNRLAIRITNPGGRYDWEDYTLLTWGNVNLYRSHGFGGLDRGLVLQGVPRGGRIADAWVLNTPNPRSILAHALLEGDVGNVHFEVVDTATGSVVARADASASSRTARGNVVRASLTCDSAKLWDLTTPVLYELRVTGQSGGQTDKRSVTFGFRWFAPDGLGTDALFRLNGKRIKLYSAVSWGYWGINGLWPTPELAKREVTQAKTLGLNCLNFHRNVGKEDVLEAHDRLGLLRYMEPGGGTLAIPRSGKPSTPADDFSRQFMLAKCQAMVRTFRSHPSLIQYTLQNELVARLDNPATFIPLQIMHEEDPSRMVVLCDGFNSPKENAPQAWYAPYNDIMHRSDREEYGGWWDKHQGAAEQWYDRLYRGPTSFNYYQPVKTALLEFGEMQGCAVPDNHPLMIYQIEQGKFGGNGKSYDLEDHKAIVAGCEQFLDRWGFRKAFPTAEALYRSLGQRAYESWQQYMENVRICDQLDFACISGWESTAVDNHAGIVDSMRNFKGDPQLIASSLLPVRPIAKQHSMSAAVGESITFDLFLLNDTSSPVQGKLNLSMVSPGGVLTELGSWPAPAHVTDQFTYPIKIGYETPALREQGMYRIRFSLDSFPLNGFTREIWVADVQPHFARNLNIALSNVLPGVRAQVSALPGVFVSEFSRSETYDLIVSSGVAGALVHDARSGEVTGLDAPPAKGDLVAHTGTGRIAEEVMRAVQSGTPLLAMVPDDSLADGVATQMAAAGAFSYRGLVGRSRATWMGSWLFVRDHPTFQALPTDRGLSVHYQPDGSSNGLLVDRAPGAPDIEVILGYSRDHDRQVGAASFVAGIGKGRCLFHRAPPFSKPLQQRWLANVITYLTQA